jgi:hypothetical protein
MDGHDFSLCNILAVSENVHRKGKDKTFPFQHEQAVCDDRGIGEKG